MYEAEVAEKQAGALERRANAVQKLADAGLKTAQSAMPFPAPPEQFLNGIPAQQQAFAQQKAQAEMMASQLAPQGMPSMDTLTGAGVSQDINQMGEPNMPPMMPSMPPLIPGAGQ
jgi:hypothetical protein